LRCGCVRIELGGRVAETVSDCPLCRLMAVEGGIKRIVCCVHVGGSRCQAIIQIATRYDGVMLRRWRFGILRVTIVCQGRIYIIGRGFEVCEAGSGFGPVTRLCRALGRL
jgi:hypothetical protein